MTLTGDRSHQTCGGSEANEELGGSEANEELDALDQVIQQLMAEAARLSPLPSEPTRLSPLPSELTRLSSQPKSFTVLPLLSVLFPGNAILHTVRKYAPVEVVEAITRVPYHPL